MAQLKQQSTLTSMFLSAAFGIAVVMLVVACSGSAESVASDVSISATVGVEIPTSAADPTEVERATATAAPPTAPTTTAAQSTPVSTVESSPELTPTATQEPTEIDPPSAQVDVLSGTECLELADVGTGDDASTTQALEGDPFSAIVPGIVDLSPAEIGELVFVSCGDIAASVYDNVRAFQKRIDNEPTPAPTPESTPAPSAPTVAATAAPIASPTVAATAVPVASPTVAATTAPGPQPGGNPCPNFSVDDIHADLTGDWDNDRLSNSYELYNHDEPCVYRSLNCADMERLLAEGAEFIIRKAGAEQQEADGEQEDDSNTCLFAIRT